MKSTGDKLWEFIGAMSYAVFRGRPPGVLGMIARVLNERRRRKQMTRKFTQTDFLRIQPILSERRRSGASIDDLLLARAISDMPFVNAIKRLKSDFHLARFVETGTYDGDTSLFMSLLFKKVYTCDVIDHPKRPDFFLAGNIVYETLSSPDFLSKHVQEFRSDSMFYLDAHWWEYWPIRDELKIVFEQCRNQVVIIDDFDAGSGLSFSVYAGKSLNLSYIRDLLPPNYRFFYNTGSYCGTGKIFIFPPGVPYGCEISKADSYNESIHGLWDKVQAGD